MGEARYRKQADANFGKVPKEIKSKGLIVCPPLEIQGSRLHAKLSNIDSQELRFALFFWDRLVWPSSQAIHFASNPDEKFLEESKILSRPDYTIWGDVAQGILKGQLKAFSDRDASEPGVWALAHGENSLLAIDDFAVKDKGALVELVRAIPIPNHDVPLNEILELKERRRDELNLLRHSLDLFVSEIEAAEDKPAALNQRIAEVDKACANLLQIGKEWQFPVSLSNLKVSLSLTSTKLLPAMGTGWYFGQSYGLPAAATAAAIIGAVSTLEIKGDYGLRSVRRPASPYRYAYRLHQELM
jgi:Family of unknown function (DUF6236)